MIRQEHVEKIKSEIEAVRKKMRKNRLKILLQIPEGLKPEAIKLIDSLSDFCDVIMSAEPCYGACDLRCEEARLLGCDVILHIGHIKFYKDVNCEVPVIYFPVDIDVTVPIDELEKIPCKKVGLVSTVQHLKSLEKIKLSLEKIGKKGVVGGEVLGCWFYNAKKIEDKVDCFLLVASGRFHALGLKTEKPVFIFDTERNKIEKIDDREKIKMMKIVYARLEKLRTSKRIGIILSKKPGQFYREYEKLKEKLENMGKKVYILIVDRITNEKILGLNLDILINTACPRIVEDKFDKPIINVEDVMKFLTTTLTRS